MSKALDMEAIERTRSSPLDRAERQLERDGNIALETGRPWLVIGTALPLVALLFVGGEAMARTLEWRDLLFPTMWGAKT